MDSIDLTLMRALAMNGRSTFAELADIVGLSGPSTADRVRRLEDNGDIRGYAALVEPSCVGLDLTAFIAVSLAVSGAREAFLAGIADVPGVVECHHTAGDDDYLLKVHCAGTRGLDRLVSEGIKGLPGVARTKTTVVLSSPLERVLVPAQG